MLEDGTSKGLAMLEPGTHRGNAHRFLDLGLCQTLPISVATRFVTIVIGVSIRWLRSPAGNRSQPRHVAPREVGRTPVKPHRRMKRPWPVPLFGREIVSIR